MEPRRLLQFFLAVRAHFEELENADDDYQNGAGDDQGYGYVDDLHIIKWLQKQLRLPPRTRNRAKIRLSQRLFLNSDSKFICGADHFFKNACGLADV